jgi:hypothetical protein
MDPTQGDEGEQDDLVVIEGIPRYKLSLYMVRFGEPRPTQRHVLSPCLSLSLSLCVCVCVSVCVYVYGSFTVSAGGLHAVAAARPDLSSLRRAQDGGAARDRTRPRSEPTFPGQGASGVVAKRP